MGKIFFLMYFDFFLEIYRLIWKTVLGIIKIGTQVPRYPSADMRIVAFNKLIFVNLQKFENSV
jgi:type II restriction/modification system DNA methylase subunit YeeA